ncbi:MAG TPA: hypothetical protein VLK30_09260 [Candidatus Limnocylindrales bacterium]|nr:hypothetical protein [Candidatus Limnocylindrales bacterium]
MSDENFRRELNSVFDEVSGTPDPALRERVRGAIGNAPEARGTYWIAGVAAAVIAVLVVGVLVVAGPLKRPSSTAGGGGVHATPSAAPSPTASPTPSDTATPSQLPAFTCASQDFVFKQTSPPQPTPPVAYISSLRAGTHGTYDRVTIEFGNGVPHDVQVSGPNAGTTFTLSPSGMQVTLKGDHGILVIIHGADLHTAYSGSTDIVAGYPTVAEVRRVEDFEGVVQVGLGVNGAGCYRAFWLTGPDRLVIDVQAA